MKPALKERIFWWTAIPVLAGVLVVLAVMQYRWSGQVSDAARAQMQSNLHLALAGFRIDFTRELGAACVEVRTAVRESGSKGSEAFSQRFQLWQQSSAHPGLVSEVYLWQSGDQDRLLRLYPAGDKTRGEKWPEKFARVKERLQEMSDMAAQAGGGPRWLNGPRTNGGPRRRAGRENAGDRRTARQSARMTQAFVPWLVDQSIPVLVSVVRSQNVSGEGADPAALSWVIVRLNPSVLEKEIFPELTQRYFSASGGLDYHVAVTDGSSPQERVLYSSSAGYHAASNQKSDAEADLFGPFFRRNGAPGARLDLTGPDMLGARQMGRPPANQQQGQAQTQTDERHDPSEAMVRLEPFRYSADDGIWKVRVQHPSGSVEAAVGALRQRNLTMSFGVLVLLVVTMGMVVVASQRARRLARLQMDFVAGVSHELRTPLAVISSAAENIAHGVVADKQQLARYGASIVKQTRQLTTLVDQVLVFAATQQQPQRYQLRPVDINEVIAAALENTASVVSAAGAKVERDIEAGLPPVSADFSALSQCLQNLITNAVKYGGEDHWVGLRAAARNDGATAREVEITVADHGMGIGEQELKHIFKPFYRSPSVAGSNIHGTGLGLPLAKTVIEAMRGSLTVQSEPGKGSSFTIRLAVAEGLREPGEKMSGRVSAEAAGETS